MFVNVNRVFVYIQFLGKLVFEMLCICMVLHFILPELKYDVTDKYIYQVIDDILLWWMFCKVDIPYCMHFEMLVKPVRILDE